jgi:hypothetical protein
MFSLKILPPNVRQLAMSSMLLVSTFSTAATYGVDSLPNVMASSSLGEFAVFSQVDQSTILSRERLAQLRGGTEVVNNDQKLNGVVSQNTAENLTSGANTISNGAFANASGIPIVIQNSGANVLIQNATVINLQIK